MQINEMIFLNILQTKKKKKRERETGNLALFPPLMKMLRFMFLFLCWFSHV